MNVSRNRSELRNAGQSRCRAADAGCCQDVPGRPSKHGANIDAYWSRPLWLRELETRPGESGGIVVKGTGGRAQRNAAIRVRQEMSSRFAIPAGGAPGPFGLLIAFGIPLMTSAKLLVPMGCRRLH